MALIDKTYIKKSSTAAPTAEAVSSFDATAITSSIDGGGAAGIANGDPASAATGVSSALSSVLGANTTNSAAAAVKLPVRDPIKSTFSNKGGGPSSQGFITNPTRGSLDDLNIGQDNTSADALDSTLTSDLLALATRFGSTVPTNNQELATLRKQAGAVGGAMSSASVFTKLPAASEILTPPPPIGSSSSSSSAEAAAFAKFLGQQVNGRGLGAALTNDVVNTLAEGFTAGLPALADAAGDAISGLDVDISPEMLDMIKLVGATAFSIATDAYCAGATPFANRQNLFNSIIGLTARQGIICALAGFLSETAMIHSSTKTVLRSTLSEVSGKGMATVVDLIATSVGPGTLQNHIGLASNLIRKGTVDAYDAVAIGDAMTTLGVLAGDMVSSPMGESADTVWDVGAIQSMDSTTLDTLLGQDITKLTDRSNEIKVERWSPLNLTL